MTGLQARDASGALKRRAGGQQEVHRALLVKELLAHIAEQKTGTLIALALEVIRAMRAWLREHGFAQLASRGMSDIFTSSSKADWPRRG